MKRYDSYKGSEVEWIGEIPSHWKKGKLYQYSELSNGSTPSRVKPEYWENGTIPWMSSGEINKKRIREIDGRITHEGFENSSTKLLPVGTVMMGLNGQGRTKGTVGILEIETTCNQSLCGMIFNDDIYPMFGYYFLDSQYYHVRGLVGEGQREGISTSFLSRYPLVIPPLSEQQQIVSFLDKKTSLIDSLIDKTQLKIELLKEKRTSLINEVVTKGLNPNVEMKNSGVEWIGEIPNHWEFVRIGHLNRVVRGGSPRPSGDPRFFNGDFIHWITVKDITSKTGKYVTTTDTKLTEEGMKQSRVLEPETLVLTNSGVTLGIPGILKIRGCINDGSVSFLDMSPKIERDYLYYFWTTQTELLLEQQSGYGQPNLNIEIVSNVRFPLPPLSEQEQIVEYLDEQTGLIYKTISIEEKRIKLLKEYRQSLISEVVTGKRKVV